MKSYAVYNTATGDILRIVKCPESMAAAQAGEGESVKKCGTDVNDVTHNVVDGWIGLNRARQLS